MYALSIRIAIASISRAEMNTAVLGRYSMNSCIEHSDRSLNYYCCSFCLNLLLYHFCRCCYQLSSVGRTKSFCF